MSLSSGAVESELRVMLSRSAIFADLSDADYDLLLEGNRPRLVKRDHLLFCEDEPGDDMFLILEGEVAIERTVEKDNGLVTIQLAVRREQDIIGEQAVFDRSHRSADARTLTAVSLLRLSRERVTACAEQSPRLALNMVRYLSQKLREATERRTNFVREVRERVAKELAREITIHGVEVDGVGIGLWGDERRISQSEFAQRLGCTREVVNRTLAELARLGEIEQDKRGILVRDTNRRRIVAAQLIAAAKHFGKAADGKYRIPREEFVASIAKKAQSSLDLIEDDLRYFRDAKLVTSDGSDIVILDGKGLSAQTQIESRLIEVELR